MCFAITEWRYHVWIAPQSDLIGQTVSRYAALLLSKHLAKHEPDAASLGAKGGTVIAQRGPEYCAKIGAMRKNRKGGSLNYLTAVPASPIYACRNPAQDQNDCHHGCSQGQRSHSRVHHSHDNYCLGVDIRR